VKRLKISHLEIAVMNVGAGRVRSWDRVVYVDWRLPEKGNRWRFQFSNRPLWIAMDTPRPTRHSRWPSPIFWAFWAKGND